jgi:mannose-6-phosphate isomerase-like protein (cupin superfamily)
MSFVVDIEKRSLENDNFREVLFTAEHCQLVVMAIAPGEEIGLETHHDVDQFIRIEAGMGKSILNGEERAIAEGMALVIPVGTEHNIVNTSEHVALKLYTIYAPPHHPDGTIHRTKAEAEAAEEHR